MSGRRGGARGLGVKIGFGVVQYYLEKESLQCHLQMPLVLICFDVWSRLEFHFIFFSHSSLRLLLDMYSFSFSFYFGEADGCVGHWYCGY